jgi:hypothetical protein
LKKYALIGIVSFLLSPVQATTGGPELLECLGWNAQTKTVFFLRVYRDESDRPPVLLRLNVDSGRIQEEPRSNVPLDDRLVGLEKELTPLTFTPADGFELRPQIIKTRPVTVQEVVVRRWKIRYTITGQGWMGRGDAVTYHDTLVRVLDWVIIPNTQRAIAIVSYTGLAHEGGYEKQDVVVLKSKGE